MKAELGQIEIEKIKVSKHNPRKFFDPARMSELVASIKRVGVLQPILVRPVMVLKNKEADFSHFELVAGERRYRAAKEAGLETIPANIRELTEEQALETQVLENLDRQDLHPIEEAEGFRNLMTLPGYDAVKISERVGRSVQFVYDRMKLCDLIEPLKKDFRENKFTAGHAILISRLSAAEQKRASDKDMGGLWTEEDAHFEEIVGKSDGYKLRSVRELQQWIDEHCRFVPERDADPMLFPETAALIKSADPKKKSDKIVHITYGYVQESARNGEKHIAPTSWKQADGKNGSKSCEFSLIGVVIAGEDRAKAFRVCINKEKCKTHWGEWQRERAKTRNMSSTGDKAGLADQREKQRQKEAQAELAREEAQERWRKGKPALLAALASGIKKASTKPKGLLAKLVIDYCEPGYGPGILDKTSVPRGKSSDDVLRHCSFLLLQADVNDWDEFPKTLKKYFGLDAKKILEKANE